MKGDYMFGENHGCHRSGNGQGKVRKFDFESGKIDSLKKVRKIEI